MTRGGRGGGRNPATEPGLLGRTGLAAGGGSGMSEDKMDRRASRAVQQSREIEENQEALRRSIAETERLVSQSEDMLRRHRREREDDDSGCE